MLNCFLSLVSVSMYVIQSYYDEHHWVVYRATADDMKLMEELDTVGRSHSTASLSVFHPELAARAGS